LFYDKKPVRPIASMCHLNGIIKAGGDDLFDRDLNIGQGQGCAAQGIVAGRAAHETRWLCPQRGLDKVQDKGRNNRVQRQETHQSPPAITFSHE
jgi:hypothetical protein